MTLERNRVYIKKKFFLETFLRYPIFSKFYLNNQTIYFTMSKLNREHFRNKVVRKIMLSRRPTLRTKSEPEMTISSR